MDLFNSPRFASRAEELMCKHHVPGLAVALVKDQVTASVGYGHASIDPPKPCTADTIFDIASASKSLTAASIAVLVSDEKYPELRWDATVSSLLPDDFILPGAGYTEAVTVDDMISHRTGMPRHDDSYLGTGSAKIDDARSVTRNLRNLYPATPVRSRFIYNNMMYTVATHLVEEKTAKSFADFLHETFFQPLGMHSTNLQPGRARANGLSDRIATAYEWDEKSKSYKGFEGPHCPEAQGAGSIMTSVNDYVKWVKAMMSQEGPVTEDVYQGLVKLRSIPDTDPFSKDIAPFCSPVFYTAGLEIFYYRGYTVIGHDGSIPGFGSRHFFLPHFKFGAALFGNSGSGSNTVIAILARELIDDLLKVPESERSDWEEFLCKGDDEDQISSEGHKKSDAEKEEEEVEEIRQRLCPGIKESEPQKLPLGVYTGEYWNPGYHSMVVQIRDDKLFIDASDRSMAFTVLFDHVCDQTKYIAHARELLGGVESTPMRAEFRFENDKPVKMGLHLELELDGLIWFHKV